jgi:D-inositol-3-phosphate glycosyltransferase
MQSSDLVVIPSIREPFGIAAVESMGLGVPTVTSYVDGLIEVVGSSDPIDDIDPGDDIKLADTIALLASDSLLRGKLIEVRSKRVRELFDIQRSASKWVDILWE